MELKIASTLDGRDLAVVKSIININNIFGDLNLVYVVEPEPCHVLLFKSEDSSESIYQAKDCLSGKQYPIEPSLNPMTVRAMFEFLGKTMKDMLGEHQHTTTQISSVQHFILQQCEKNKDKVLLIEHPEFVLIIDNEQKIVKSTLKLTDELFESFAGFDISNIQFKYIEPPFNPEHQHQMALNKFMWNLGFFLEKELMSQHYNDSKKFFKLVSWPNFGVYKFVPEFINLSSLLKKQAYSYQQLLSVSGYPSQTINKFLNATIMAGLVNVVDSDQQVITTQRKNSPFISSLKKFFGFK